MKFQNKYRWSAYEISKQAPLICVWNFKTSSVDLLVKFKKNCWSMYEFSKQSSVGLPTSFQNKFYWSTYEFSKQVVLMYVWNFKTSSVDPRMKFYPAINGAYITYNRQRNRYINHSTCDGSRRFLSRLGAGRLQKRGYVSRIKRHTSISSLHSIKTQTGLTQSHIQWG
jgi:hypothetical protein